MRLPSLHFAGFDRPFGDDTTAPSAIDTIRAYIPLVGETIAAASIGGDVRVQIATLQAKIQNLEGMKKTVPAMSFFYENEIVKKKAQLAAMQGSLTRQQETETAASGIKTLGTVAVGLAVVGAAGLAAFLVALAIRTAKG